MGGLISAEGAYRPVASGGGGAGGQLTPGPVEPDTSSLWMELFSLDSVILIKVTFSLFEVDFSETYLMTSAENSVSEPPNLKKFIPQTPLQGSCLRHSK